MKKTLKIALVPLVALFLWVSYDLNVPVQRDISIFDGRQTARLEAEMWKAYYEKRKFDLLWKTAEVMRKEYQLPFWRSFQASYLAAEAAFRFKKGSNLAEYRKAYPALRRYFQLVNEISIKKFDVDKATENELEWWIIRRYRDEHPPHEWEECLVRVAASIHELPPENFRNYARLRVRAMVFRDKKGRKITEADWSYITQLLEEAWVSMENNIRAKNT